MPSRDIMMEGNYVGPIAPSVISEYCLSGLLQWDNEFIEFILKIRGNHGKNNYSLPLRRYVLCPDS